MAKNYWCKECRELWETDDMAICDTCDSARDNYDDYYDEDCTARLA